MTVFMVETYVVKPEKQGEFMPLIQGLLKYVKENPEKYKEMKSWKLFVQTFGGISGAYIEMIECDNMADVEKLMTRLFKDEGHAKIYQELMLLIDPATYSMNLWNSLI